MDIGFVNCICCSVTKSCPALCDPMDCSTPVFPVLLSLPEFAQTHVLWVSDTIWSSHPLLPSSPFAFNLSQHQGLFQWVGSLHPSTKLLELQLQHEYSGLISFRVDWFDHFVVQRTLKSLLQHHNSKAPILCHWAFFVVQLSHLYMQTRQTIALTIRLHLSFTNFPDVKLCQ